MVQNRETVTTKELAHSLLNAVLFRTKLSDVEQQQAFQRHGTWRGLSPTDELLKILEGHSVERMYLRQSCSDGSIAVNKTVVKPRLAAAQYQVYANTYRLDFSRRN